MTAMFLQVFSPVGKNILQSLHQTQHRLSLDLTTYSINFFSLFIYKFGYIQQEASSPLRASREL